MKIKCSMVVRSFTPVLIYLQYLLTGCLFAGFFLISESPASATQNTSQYKRQYDFGKLRFKEIRQNDDILNDLYKILTENKATVNDIHISLTLYVVKNDELIPNENIPKSIVVLKSKGKTLKLPIDAYQPMTEISFFVPRTKTPMICIQNPRGGNGWNSNPYYVISLDPRHFLKKSGLASGRRDLNHDGSEVLIAYDDIWEIGWGHLSHADAPGAIIALGVKNGKIVSDVMRYKEYYSGEITRLNTEIKKYSSSMPPKMNGQLLSFILQKFLIFRLLDDKQTGWTEFKKDIMHYDPEYFYLNTAGDRVEMIAIDEIIARMKKSLKERRSLIIWN